MSELQRYRRRAQATVSAVQIDLDTEGFSYRKWGGVQKAKPGDWLVSNHGDTYTVDRETFARTYRAASPGTYVKVAPIWARQAEQAGSIATKEGSTEYQPGDWLVFNEPDGSDGYAISAQRFSELYEPVED